MVGVGPSTHVTYPVAWTLWAEWRTVATHKRVHLDVLVGEAEKAIELAKGAERVSLSRTPKFHLPPRAQLSFLTRIFSLVSVDCKHS